MALVVGGCHCKKHHSRSNTIVAVMDAARDNQLQECTDEVSVFGSGECESGDEQLGLKIRHLWLHYFMQ